MTEVLGYVTSANYGHSIGRGIVYGYLPMSHSEVGTGLMCSTLASVFKLPSQWSLFMIHQGAR